MTYILEQTIIYELLLKHVLFR